MNFVKIKETSKYENKDYIVTVMKADFIKSIPGLPNLFHVTIVRKDHNKVTDWEELQRIKDHVIGEDYTALQIFPAKADVVNYSNAYHLWVFDSRDFRLPFLMPVQHKTKREFVLLNETQN